MGLEVRVRGPAGLQAGAPARLFLCGLLLLWSVVLPGP